ncbi:MAG: RDD family protein [Actinobacteria bacterium]|nr:RDD family protein [Actinomycetota bacterium]
MDRRDVASWLQGPRQTLEDQGYEFGYKGERLGLPESGPGSVAPMGRRVVALIVDWLASMLVARLLFGGDGQDLSLETLAVFALMTMVLLSFGGASFGQRLMGLRVVSVTGGAVSIPRVVLRTLLLCLVVPAVVWDRDQRGLHDQAAKSVVVRVR